MAHSEREASRLSHQEADECPDPNKLSKQKRGGAPTLRRTWVCRTTREPFALVTDPHGRLDNVKRPSVASKVWLSTKDWNTSLKCRSLPTPTCSPKSKQRRSYNYP